jgi:hypothetical protein
MYNGIAVGIGKNVTIADNIVQPYTDISSGIVIDRNTNATIANNHVGSIQTLGVNPGVSLSGNTTLKATAIGNIDILGSLPHLPVVAAPPSTLAASGRFMEFDDGNFLRIGDVSAPNEVNDQQQVSNGPGVDSFLVMANSSGTFVLEGVVYAGFSSGWIYSA